MKEVIEEHKQVLSSLEKYTSLIEKIATLCISSLKKGGKIVFCGNGGSAADSQHLAAELVGRFLKEKKPLASLALSVNTSILTAVGNDYGFGKIFSKQIEALGEPKDLLIAISTSGNSKNVIEAVRKAKEKGIKTIGFLGKDGGKLKKIVDIPLIVESNNTARIQEMHILIGHILCEIIEEEYIEKSSK
ncbi:MAG: phosphoheptose isomerase [Candidatus Omnitrophica bacterium 4484_70.1]|nr:MAG: phosphoheptose isomerase [Candidatus Omnitrophica bacterium 4484_70.1]